MIARLQRSLRDQGARGTLAQLSAGLRQGYAAEEVLVMSKDLGEIVTPGNTNRLRIEELESGHLEGLRALNRRRGELQADRYFENSLSSGFHGFAAMSDGELVGYYWWVDCANPTPHPDVWRLGKGFRLGPGDVYGASLFLLEEHRGAGRAEEFLFKVESALRERGFKRIWGYVDEGNRGARWLYTIRGYQPVRWVRIQRLGPFRRRRSKEMSDGD